MSGGGGVNSREREREREMRSLSLLLLEDSRGKMIISYPFTRERVVKREKNLCSSDLKERERERERERAMKIWHAPSADIPWR